LEPLEDRTLPSGYTFTRLTDAETDPYWPPSTSAINSSGAVAFHASLRDSVTTGIYVASGGTVTTIAQTGSTFGAILKQGALSVNDAGQVAFTARPPTPSVYGLYVGDGTTTSLILQEDANFYSFSRPLINNAGDVAFSALQQTSPGVYFSGIFLYQAGTVRTLVLNSATFSTGYFDLNNQGQIAFFAQDGANSGGIFVTDGSALITVAHSGSQFTLNGLQHAQPRMNDSGVVAFTAITAAGTTGVFTGNGGPLTTIASDPTQGFSDAVVNAVGDVGYVGGSNTSAVYVYDGESHTTATLIRRGDPLDGKSFAGAPYGIALNDAGQLALVAVRTTFNPTTNYYDLYRADPVLPTLSVADTSVTEGNAGTTSATFTVTLSAASSKTVTVNYATANGSATTADNDYVASSGTLTFAPGETSKPITVPVNGDSKHEPDETFTVTLSNPVRATLATATGTGTVQNDDPVPALSISGVALPEGNGGTTPFSFSVTLSNPSSQMITVNYATAGGSATAGEDYATTSGTLTIPAGSLTGIITVPVNGDNTYEPDETFTVSLSGAANATIATATATGTIRNDDTDPYLVTTTNDSGAGSLRQALLNANAHAGLDTIRFAIGAGVQTIRPITRLPSITDPVTIDGTTQPGFAGAPIIELRGDLAGASGLWIGVPGAARTVGSGTTVRGLVINRWSGNGIEVFSDGNTIEGNYIGTDVTGTLDLGNAFAGVRFSGSSNNTLGGTTAAARNVIAGNDRWNVLVANGASGNVVAGNYIGANAAGTARVAGGNGVVITDGGSGNVVGGSEPGAGNLISGNGGTGVVIAGGATNTRVQGNRIGTTADGTAPLGNGGYGVVIGNATTTANVIGTDGDGVNDAAEGNVIAANTGIGGVQIGNGAHDNVVAGNFIGTNAAGAPGLGNAVMGVWLVSGANRNRVGTNGDGVSDGVEGNLIRGNGNYGIEIGDVGTTLNVIAGNVVGPNASHGVFARRGAAGNRVGTDGNGVGDAAEGNVIAGNGGAGVLVADAGTGNAIRGNAIYNNGGLGIDLIGNGVTANDPLDADTGPNNLQNFPRFTARTGAVTRVAGTFAGAANVTITLDFYANAALDPSGHGEGQRYLGSATVTTDATGRADFDVTLAAATAAGEFVTATATDAAGNTSEFSPAQAAPVGVQGVVINQGQAQRSLVTRIDITFAGLVTVDPAAVHVTRTGGGDPEVVNVVVGQVGGQTVVTLTFAGASVVNGSLQDGNYLLTIDAAGVRDANGLRLDGDGDGLAGGDAASAFFRLFGDGNGDGKVDNYDLGLFRSTYGKRAGDAGFLAYFDYDGGGVVDLSDYNQFRLRYGRAI
jgi:hypothetical protein